MKHERRPLPQPLFILVGHEIDQLHRCFTFTMVHLVAVHAARALHEICVCAS